MKSILISIKPKWVAKILNGEKTIEIRKTMPKCELPITCYIYCTKESAKYYIKNKIYNSMINGKVVAKFTLNKVEEMYYCDEEYLKLSCLNIHELFDYLGEKIGYAWHIDDLEIFNIPIELNKFKRYCDKHFDSWKTHCLNCKAYTVDSDIEDWCDERKLTLSKPPQSYCFVEKIEIHQDKGWF